MRRFLAAGLAAGFLGFTSLAAMAATPVPPQALAGINSVAKAGAHAQACDMVNFLPAYWSAVPGRAGHVAVGILDIDPENCGANYVSTSLAVYRVEGSRTLPVALPASLAHYMIQKVDRVTPVHGGMRITVSYIGPGDPMCCAKHELSVFVRL